MHGRLLVELRHVNHMAIPLARRKYKTMDLVGQTKRLFKMPDLHGMVGRTTRPVVCSRAILARSFPQLQAHRVLMDSYLRGA